MDSSSFGINLLSLPATVGAFLLYYGCHRLLQLVACRISPQFYTQLQKDQKDVRYFSFILGIAITFISTPACTVAFLQATDHNDVRGKPLLSSAAAQVCVASRTVLWTSELNRLDYASGYVYHHVLSLLDLAYQLHARMPMRPHFALYASLATELLSNLGCVLAIMGLKAVNSSLAYRVQASNTALLLFLRIPPIIYSAMLIPSIPGQSWEFWLNIARVAIYAKFSVGMFLSEAKRLRMIELEMRKPAHAIICQRYKLYLYGVAVCAAVLAVVTSTLALYANAFPNAWKALSSMDIAATVLFTICCALFGARLPAILSEYRSSGLLRFQILSEAGYWLQTGVVGAVFGVLLSGATFRVDARVLIATLLISLPLGESIGRVGCQFGGCCGGVSHHQWMHVPTQLFSSTLNLAAFAGSMLLFHSERMSLYSVATLSVSLNALIRLLVQPLRRDSNGRLINCMSLFAVGQLGCAIWMSLTKIENGPTDISGHVLLSTTSDAGLSVIYYLAPLLCALPVILKVCSTAAGEAHRPSGILQACSKGEDAPDQPSGILQACSKGEDATDQPSGILQACSKGEDAIERVSTLVLRGYAVSQESSRPRPHSMLSTIAD
ncbi:hypothetical protein G647_04850 [Cladophialophora carrionii CBS 160.54]|uniref:Uncharacterized protein n=1 Tax=Cladophialophora carrionii CBS 160.54 TaxID=1279043 RepID=V9D812_9EURO|nr:uncharacterized protein G647_04850 [Cladophialophora carrionii CBS 160.54]ETI23054.1 hypothetical protein G647_04850 [Cladophialophora carrionii CBS 160.54]